jgi:hypothetical protein
MTSNGSSDGGGDGNNYYKRMKLRESHRDARVVSLEQDYFFAGSLLGFSCTQQPVRAHFAPPSAACTQDRFYLIGCEITQADNPFEVAIGVSTNCLTLATPMSGDNTSPTVDHDHDFRCVIEALSTRVFTPPCRLFGQSQTTVLHIRAVGNTRPAQLATGVITLPTETEQGGVTWVLVHDDHVLKSWILGSLFERRQSTTPEFLPRLVDVGLADGHTFIMLLKEDLEELIANAQTTVYDNDDHLKPVDVGALYFEIQNSQARALDVGTGVRAPPTADTWFEGIAGYERMHMDTDDVALLRTINGEGTFKMRVRSYFIVFPKGRADDASIVLTSALPHKLNAAHNPTPAAAV